MDTLTILHSQSLAWLGLVLVGLTVAWLLLHSANELLDAAIFGLRNVIKPEAQKLKTRVRELAKTINGLFDDDTSPPPA